MLADRKKESLGKPQHQRKRKNHLKITSRLLQNIMRANAFQLCRNENQEFGDNKKQNNMSSSHDLHAITKQVISSRLLKRTAAKCVKSKNARATRAKLLVFIVKYKNL